MARILLVNPPTPFLAFPNAGPHLGVGYLVSYLRSHGIGADYLNFEAYNPATAEVPEGYDFYGFTAVTPQYFFAKLLLHQVKSKKLGRAVIGGAHASLLPNECLKDGFDFVVRGYGETALLGILRNERSPGIIQGEAFPNLDDLPFPAWEDLRIDYDVSYGKRTAHIFSARGCPYGCYYCCSPRIYGCFVQYRGIDNVLAEVCYLIERFGIDSLYFFDPTFTLNKTRALQLAQKLGQLSINWTCQTRVDCIEPYLLETMRNNGCNQISLGVETGAYTAHCKLGKGTDLDQNARAIKLAREAGMRVKTFLMGALPEDNWETLESFKRFISENRPDSWLYSTFIPFPGTAFWDKPEEFGIKIHCRDFRTYYPLGLNARGPLNISNRFLSRGELLELRDNMLSFLREAVPNPRVEEAIHRFARQRSVFLPYLEGLDTRYMF